VIISIRPLNPTDLPAIADLHLKYLTSYLPHCLQSISLLSLYYLSLCEIGNIALAAYNNEEIVGFICIVNSTKSIFLYQLRKYFFQTIINVTALICLNRLKPWHFIKDLVERLKYFRKRINLPELRPIVVHQDFQDAKVAKSLVTAAEMALRNKGLHRYFLRVQSNNLRALRFYEKNGFTVKAREGNAILVMEKILT
jgi:ribosomal protein S18 acetylase RimI-like enzyme